MLIKKWKLKKDLRKFIFENYYNWIDFTKRSYYLLKKAKKHLVLFANNLAREIPDPTKTREHNELLFLKKGEKKFQSKKTCKKPRQQWYKVCCCKTASNLSEPIYQSNIITQELETEKKTFLT